MLSSSKVISMNVFSFLWVAAATSFTFELSRLPMENYIKDKTILPLSHKNKHTLPSMQATAIRPNLPTIPFELTHHRPEDRTAHFTGMWEGQANADGSTSELWGRAPVNMIPKVLPMPSETSCSAMLPSEMTTNTFQSPTGWPIFKYY